MREFPRNLATDPLSPAVADVLFSDLLEDDLVANDDIDFAVSKTPSSCLPSDENRNVVTSKARLWSFSLRFLNRHRI